MAVTSKEEVLSLVWDSLKTVANIQTFARNRGLMANEMRPALIMLDGDLADGLVAPKNGRGGSFPIFATTKVLRPQIFVLPKTLKPTNKVGADNIANVIAPYEKSIVGKVLANAALTTLLGSNGGLQYLGHETDLNSGASMDGQIKFNFQITFVFDPR